MKPRLPNLLALLLNCLGAAAVGLVAASAQVSDTPPPLGEQASAPSPAAVSTPATPQSAPKRIGQKEAAKTPRVRTPKPPKEITFPLPIGEPSHDFKLPQLGSSGELISQLMTAKITRLDNEHVEMHETRIDLNHPDGKQDFHVLLPDSIFNLQTHIIHSDHPVTIRTDDFELTGERMEFNTVDRTGELQGHVHMVIHNFKQVAGVIPATPAP